MRVPCALARDGIAGGGRSDLDGLMTGATSVCGKWAVKHID